MFPNIGLKAGTVRKRVLLVCGESVADVVAAFGAIGVRYEKIAECREFRTFDCEWGVPFTACVAGLGSASVEVALTELSMCGGKAFVLSGTCGTLSDTFRPGEIVLFDSGLRYDGASYHYLEGPREIEPDAGDLKKARDILDAAEVEYRTGCILSTDTFYCMGAGADEKENVVYPGLALKKEFSPPPAFVVLKEMIDNKEPYLIDMETAALYAICSTLEKHIFNISVKGVANAVPFIEGEQSGNTADCMKKAISAACTIIRGL